MNNISMYHAKEYMNYEQVISEFLEENYYKGSTFYENEGMKKYFQEIRKTHKYLCIFGAGLWGNAFCQWLMDYGIKVDFFCDNNETKVGNTINGVPVISFKELQTYKNEIFVMVAVTNKERHYNDEINQQISDFPYKMSNILKIAAFYRNDYKLSYEYCAASAKQIFQALNDEKSRELFLELLKLKFVSSAEPLIQNPLERFYEPVQYFNKCFYRNKKDAVIVDCGAFNGDSMLEYLSMFQDEFKEYHCFEMDPNILPELKNNINKLPDGTREKIYLHSCGLSDEEGFARFHLSTDTGGSSLSENGECEVPISLLDRHMKSENVSMIKMDIEGAELKALMGGTEVISRNHPVLAISIYHSTEQFFKVPMWILEHFPFYSLHIGLHTTITDDTVLYAIPNE